jgi:hypothetical protein
VEIRENGINKAFIRIKDRPIWPETLARAIHSDNNRCNDIEVIQQIVRSWIARKFPFVQELSVGGQREETEDSEHREIKAERQGRMMEMTTPSQTNQEGTEKRNTAENENDRMRERKEIINDE